MTRGGSMKARCVVNGGSPYLTEGKVYEVQVCDFDNSFYKVKNEFGDVSMHPTMFFQHLGDEKEIFELYFIKNGEETLCDRGSKEYVIELLNDWVVGCDMYRHDSATFRIERKCYGGEMK